MKQEMMGWQWHQLDHMHIYTSLQTDNHASTSSLNKAGGQLIAALEVTNADRINLQCSST